MALTNLVQQYDWNYSNIPDKDNSTLNKTLTGRHYKLTWFGNDGKSNSEASYTFPKGTHIVFFLIKDGIGKETELGTQIEYSNPKYNKWENKLWTEGHNKVYSYPNGTGEIDAVTYSWGGMTVLGFEDRGGDDDMNDILFFIKGNFANELKEIKKTEDVYEWMVACEDLGSTDDYDFNDVVFGVKHYTSSTTLFRSYYVDGVLHDDVPSVIEKSNYLMVTPYAAGGSLKSNVYYGTKDLGEIHSLLRIDQKNNYDAIESGSMPILNANSYNYQGTPFVISLDDDATFSMSSVADGDNNMGGFSIHTGDNNGVVITAPKTGDAPQMMVLPNGWDWPTERNRIYNVYEDFEQWTTDKTKNGWVNNKKGSFVTNPYKTTILEPTTGNGNTDGNQGDDDNNANKQNFPVGEETSLTVSLCDNSTFQNNAFGNQLNQNPVIYQITIGDYNVPVGKTATLKIVLSNDNNNPDCYYSPSSNSFKWGTSSWGSIHSFNLDADKVSELFRNGGFYTMWASIASVTLTLHE